jgi:hypothetical protein
LGAIVASLSGRRDLTVPSMTGAFWLASSLIAISNLLAVKKNSTSDSTQLQELTKDDLEGMCVT